MITLESEAFVNELYDAFGVIFSLGFYLGLTIGIFIAIHVYIKYAP